MVADSRRTATVGWVALWAGVFLHGVYYLVCVQCLGGTRNAWLWKGMNVRALMKPVRAEKNCLIPPFLVFSICRIAPPSLWKFQRVEASNRAVVNICVVANIRGADYCILHRFWQEPSVSCNRPCPTNAIVPSGRAWRGRGPAPVWRLSYRRDVPTALSTPRCPIPRVCYNMTLSVGLGDGLTHKSPTSCKSTITKCCSYCGGG